MKDHHHLLHYLPHLKKTCVRQVALDKWFPPSLVAPWGPAAGEAREVPPTEGAPQAAGARRPLNSRMVLKMMGSRFVSVEIKLSAYFIVSVLVSLPGRARPAAELLAQARGQARVLVALAARPRQLQQPVLEPISSISL